MPVVVNPTVFTVPIAKPEFSTRLTTPVSPAKVVMALPIFVKVKVPPRPKSSRPGAVMACDSVTVSVVERVVFPLVVNPTVLTVPIAKPLFSTRLTTPVSPAKIVMALPVLVRVKVPPKPRSSRPGAVMACDSVTVPVVERVVFPLVVKPTVLTVPIAKPLFSTRLTTPVLPAKVVIALPVLVKV